jgi:hypothetical protein
VTLEHVRAFRIATRLVDGSERALLEAGRAGYERFVLWSGIMNGDAFDVRSVVVPTQTAYKLETGLCVRVAGDELHRLNRWLYEQGETLGIQIHTHPTRAYHSETDDAFPIVTQIGALSVVVPDFCRRGLFTRGTATYRLRTGGWREVPAATAQRLIEVAP